MARNCSNEQNLKHFNRLKYYKYKFKCLPTIENISFKRSWHLNKYFSTLAENGRL